MPPFCDMRAYAGVAASAASAPPAAPAAPGTVAKKRAAVRKSHRKNCGEAAALAGGCGAPRAPNASVLGLPRLPFWVAGVVEVATGPNEGAQTTAAGKGVARVTGSFLLGFGLFGGLFGSVFVMGFLSRNF